MIIFTHLFLTVFLLLPTQPETHGLKWMHFAIQLYFICNNILKFAFLEPSTDSQRKEVVEMLEQEGLAEISQSNSSEQVAYMLVERATLLERLEAAERKLDTQTLTGNLREVHLQVKQAVLH